MSVRLFLVNAYLAIEGIFRRCPGTTRCGFLGRSIRMHSGMRGAEDCQEVCVFFLDSSLQCGGCSNEFDITLQMVDVTSPEDQALITKSRERWESILVGDVVDTIPSPTFRNLLSRACNVPIRVDDVYICLRYGALEDTIGTAVPWVVRVRDGLPIIGEIVIDIDAVNSIDGIVDTFVEDLILRQFGYALGFRSRIGSDDCPFWGPKAIAEYSSLSGCLESNIDSRFCGDFEGFDECVGNEVMTRLNRNSTNLLSRITVAALDDLGYEVDYTNVDEYTSDNINATCRCTQQRTLGADHEAIPQPSLAYKHHNPRQLYSDEYNKAIMFGKTKLAEAKEQYNSAVAMYGSDVASFNEGTGDNGQKFVGDQAIMVTFMEHGEIRSVVVRA